MGRVTRQTRRARPSARFGFVCYELNPSDIVECFAPNGIRAVPRLEPRAYALPPNIAPIEPRACRRAQRYEADEMQHVNNAVYVDWLEEALADAVALRHPKWGEAESNVARLCVRRHDIEHARSARPDDTIEIVTRPVGMGHCVRAWQLEVRRTEELLVRDHITTLWVDATGKPVRGNR
jgi:YbgC/YbaW family acyl-CoA thioester hydrolase